MYKADDMILELGETFKPFTDTQRENYRKEFTKYSDKELRKIADSIIDNHDFANIPVLGKVFQYMKQAGIHRKKHTGATWYRCKVCSTNFTIKTSLCPVCAWKGEPRKADVTTVKGERFPSNIKSFTPYCSRCKRFVGAKPIPSGASCESWGSENKTGVDCNNCLCHDCCNAPYTRGGKETNNKFHDSIIIPVEDESWINIYEPLEIVKGDEYQYAGNWYINKTGFTVGASPSKDLVNWRRKTKADYEKEKPTL
jgi:hypothetical protein